MNPIQGNYTFTTSCGQNSSMWPVIKSMKQTITEITLTIGTKDEIYVPKSELEKAIARIKELEDDSTDSESEELDLSKLKSKN